MEHKIQELTEKIYREGVEKGNVEAQRILDEAREKAQRILEEAQKEAESLRIAARKEADEETAHARAELKLFASQAVNALKSEVATLLTDRLVGEAVADFVGKTDFLNAFIVSLASKWSTQEPIVINTAEAAELQAYFATRAKDLLDKGVRIEQVNGLKTLFSISPADGAYKVNFGEEEFMNYFKAFLRPRLVEMLFQ